MGLLKARESILRRSGEQGRLPRLRLALEAPTPLGLERVVDLVEARGQLDRAVPGALGDLVAQALEPEEQEEAEDEV